MTTYCVNANATSASGWCSVANSFTTVADAMNDLSNAMGGLNEELHNHEDYKCIYCGQYGDLYQPCAHCGAPLDG